MPSVILARMSQHDSHSLQLAELRSIGSTSVMVETRLQFRDNNIQPGMCSESSSIWCKVLRRLNNLCILQMAEQDNVSDI